jgi:hypothetical protein
LRKDFRGTYLQSLGEQNCFVHEQIQEQMHGMYFNIQDHWRFRIGSSGRLFSTQYEQLGFKKGNDFWYIMSVVRKKICIIYTS